jgi:hypothetical protein
VQSAGYAYRPPKKRVKEEFSRHGQFLVLVLRYAQALITQIAQTAVCNRHHSTSQAFGQRSATDDASLAVPSRVGRGRPDAR